MHYTENTYKTEIFLTDTIDRTLHYPDYHIHVNYAIISIDMKSTRINNPTLLILYNRINTEPNFTIILKIYVY